MSAERRSRGRGLPWGLLLLAPLVLLIGSAVSLQLTDRLADSVASVSHTQRVLEQVNQLWGVLGDRDSQVLRYLLTGRERNLEEFRHSLRAFERGREQLASQLSDDPAQRALLAELESLHRARIERAERLIALKQRAERGDADAAAELDREFDGRPGSGQAEAMRALLDRMTANETARLEQRRAQRSEVIARNRQVVFAANALALLAAGAALLAILRLRRRDDEALRARLEAEQARRSNAEKSMLLASISHEIRTPMNAILGFAQLLDGRRLPPPQDEYVSAIQHGGRALLGLINDVLDLSRLDAEQLPLRPEPVAARDAAEQAVALFRADAGRRGLSLEISAPRGDEPLLQLDPGRLRQVLVNLLSNALRHTERGGIRVELAFHPQGSDRADLQIAVIDSGSGIEAAALERIFEPFVSGGTGEGAGLGLSIARRLVERMGGQLQAESTPGAGARFTLHIPKLAVVNAPTEAAAAIDEAWAALRPLDLLVVDDVELNRQLIAGYLAGSPHRLRLCANGAEALDEARRHPPDLLLLDLRMHPLSGLATLQQLRADPALIGCVALAVTATEPSADERAAFAAVLSKPVSREQLQRALLRWAPATAPAAQADPGPQRDDPAALAALQSLQQHELTKLRARLRMGEAAELAAELGELAERLQWPRLAEHARQLRIAVAAFDVAAVQRLLADCPGAGVAADD